MGFSHIEPTIGRGVGKIDNKRDHLNLTQAIIFSINYPAIIFLNVTRKKRILPHTKRRDSRKKKRTWPARERGSESGGVFAV